MYELLNYDWILTHKMSYLPPPSSSITLLSLHIYIYYRYEWSVGYADRLGPEGIFDPVNDKVWQDAGQLMDAVFTIGPGKMIIVTCI